MRPRWQLRLYEWLWAILLAAGLAGLARLWSALGKGFGGFIWQYDNNHGHSVSFEVPRHWPGPQAGLTPHTRITAIDGRPPGHFPDVYAEKPIGAPIIYDMVRANGRADRVCLPIARFTPGYLAEGYGMVFLVGLTFSGAGYLLLRSARDTGRTLLGFVMLISANTALYHGHNGNINRFYNRPIFAAIMGAPTNGVLGALLLHLALVYPRPLPLIKQHPWIIPFGYTTGLSLGSVFGAALYYGAHRQFARLQPPTQVASIAFLTIGVVATLMRGAWELLWQQDALSATERRQIRIMAVAWTLAAMVLLGALGAANLRVTVPFELFPTVATVLPIGLVYAIFNADLIAELEEQSELRGQLLSQLDELKQLRERALEDFADELHDSALADSKALEMRLYTLLRQTTEGRIEGAALRNALAELHGQGVALGRALRLTIEGVKSVDFSDETLVPALQSIVSQLNATNTTAYTLVCRGPIETASVATKEAIYWIARAALNNVRDHAEASRCVIELDCTDTNLVLIVSDNGRGSLPTDAATSEMPRRHLGIMAMRARATRLHGWLDVNAGQFGTRVVARIPLDQLETN